MKLATLFTSACLFVAAIANPIAQPDPVDLAPDDVPDPSPENVNLHQLMFPPPYNWKPGPSLMAKADSSYGFPETMSSVEFANFMKHQCDRIPTCQSIAGYKRKNSPAPVRLHRNTIQNQRNRITHGSYSTGLTFMFFKEGGGWSGYVFKIKATLGDFVRDNLARESFAFTA
ncbi:hypothetical protein EMPG_10937 [Blastomyces silverae]|uniref:Uncharacterized protein n=1 Tax=Blastomyces silverae TaxID=2060906 RepID=A0A0H1B8G0_9EURO|nr:hypothetical protein EMPG_10937 [Blastomyces silverae]